MKTAILPLICANNTAAIFNCFPQVDPVVKPRQVEELIKEDTPWSFFDGAAQKNPSLGGAGGVIHLSKDIKISFKAWVGAGD